MKLLGLLWNWNCIFCRSHVVKVWTNSSAWIMMYERSVSVGVAIVMRSALGPAACPTATAHWANMTVYGFQSKSNSHTSSCCVAESAEDWTQIKLHSDHCTVHSRQIYCMYEICKWLATLTMVYKIVTFIYTHARAHCGIQWLQYVIEM